MPQNPYASPITNKEPVRRRAWSSAVAICCWAVSLLWFAAFLAGMRRPEIIESMKEHPLRYGWFATVTFIFPSAGIALIGFAVWKRAKWPVVIGVFAFVPLIITMVMFG